MDSGSEDEMLIAPAQTGTRKVPIRSGKTAAEVAPVLSKASTSRSVRSGQTRNTSAANKPKSSGDVVPLPDAEVPADNNAMDLSDPDEMHDMQSSAPDKLIKSSHTSTKPAARKKRGKPAKIIDTNDGQPLQNGNTATAAESTLTLSAQLEADTVTNHTTNDRSRLDKLISEYESSNAEMRNAISQVRDQVAAKELASSNRVQSYLEEIRDLAVAETAKGVEQFRQLREREKKEADAVIASLKRELEALKNKPSLDSQVKALEAELQQSRTDARALQQEKESLLEKHIKTQSDLAAAQAKLQASRSTFSEGVSRDGPVTGQARTILVGSEEAKREMQNRAFKEELYSDLSELIIRDVKRKDAQDGVRAEVSFDCLQTGRNGALHFRLCIPNPQASGAGSYDKDEFTYIPLLDEQRDKSLVDVLPDYLKEEICFPRSNAAKFYSRVVDCLTRKIEEDGDDAD